MEFTDQAVILKVGRFRESDVWVRLMTPSRGMFQAFAFGGSKSRRRFCGCLDVFNQVLFTVRGDKSGRYWYLSEGSLLSGHPGLRADPERLGMARNCAAFFEMVSLGPAGAAKAYAVLCESLAAVAEGEKPYGMFPVFFRARLAHDQGFLPPLWQCSACGRDVEQAGQCRFDLAAGRLACPDCAGGGRGHGLDCSAQTAALARSVMHDPPRAWKTLAPDAAARREFFAIVDRFVRYHLGVGYEDGGFRRL